MLNSEYWDRVGFISLFARATHKQAHPKAVCICECEMQVFESEMKKSQIEPSLNLS